MYLLVTVFLGEHAMKSLLRVGVVMTSREFRDMVRLARAAGVWDALAQRPVVELARTGFGSRPARVA